MKALVTGASEGIGRAFAVALSQRGFAVTAVARNEARLQELMRELGGGGHSFIRADLSQTTGKDAVAALSKSRAGLRRRPSKSYIWPSSDWRADGGLL